MFQDLLLLSLKLLFIINIFLFFISLLFLNYWFKDNDDIFSNDYNIFNIIYDIKNNKKNDNLIFLYNNKKYFLFIFIFYIFLIILRYIIFIICIFFIIFLIKKLNNINNNNNYIFQLNKKYIKIKKNPNFFEFLYIIFIQIPMTTSFYKIYIFIFLIKNKNKFKLNYKKLFELSLQRLTVSILGGPLWLFLLSINIFKIFSDTNWNLYRSFSIISINIFENYNLYFEIVINLKIYKIFDFLICNPNAKYYLINNIYKDYLFSLKIKYDIKYSWAYYETVDDDGNKKIHYCLVDNYDLDSEYKNIIVFSRFLNINNFFNNLIFNVYNEKLEKKNLFQIINTNNIINKKDLIYIKNENLVSSNCNLTNQNKIDKLSITIFIFSGLYNQKFLIKDFKYNLLDENQLKDFKYNSFENIIKNEFNLLKNINKNDLLELSSEEFINNSNIIKFKNNFLDNID